MTYKCTGCNESFDKKKEHNKECKSGKIVKLRTLQTLNTDYITPKDIKKIIEEIETNPDKATDVMVKLLHNIFNNPEHPENHVIVKDTSDC